MPEIKWIKLALDMFDDEKIKLIENMPERDTVLTIWVKLICLAGKVNDGGYIYLTETIQYTPEDLAAILNRPLNSIRLALSLFERYGMIQHTPKGVCLVNWYKHQNMDTLDKIREDTKLRVKKFRDKQKQLLLPQSCNVTGNVTVTKSNALRSKKEEYKKEDREEEKEEEGKVSPDFSLLGNERTLAGETGEIIDDGVELWEKVKEDLGKQMSAPNFKTWIEKTRGGPRTNNHLIVMVENNQVLKALSELYLSLIKRTLIKVCGEDIEPEFQLKSKS